MAFTAKGKLIEIFDEQRLTEKFTKREFVLEIQEGQYPEQIKFQLTNQKVDIIDPYQIGQEVEVKFNLRGKGFNKNGQMQYYNNLEAWQIQYAGTPTPAPPAPTRQNNNPNLRAQSQAGAPITSGHDDSLPF